MKAKTSNFLRKITVVALSGTVITSVGYTEIGAYPGTAVTKNAAVTIVESGSCGAEDDNVTYTLDSDGVLTISGTGMMKDYYYYNQNSSALSSSPFFNNDKIKSIVIEEGVTNIGDNVFLGCKEFTNITIPESVTSIGEKSFVECAGLESVTIPDSVTSIGDYAFVSCSKLADIELSENIISVGMCAFADTAWYNAQPDGSVYLGKVYYEYKNGSEETVNVKEDTSVIADCAFSSAHYTGVGGYVYANPAGTKNLKSVNMPDSVKTIGKRSFTKCPDLERVRMSEKTETIGDSAFESCGSLDNVLFPGSVVNVGGNIFRSCTGMRKVEIEDGLTDMGVRTFYNCTSLTDIEIPDSVKSLNYYVLAYCRSLTSITIPKGVTSISSNAFNRCSALKSINVSADNENYSSDNGVLFNKIHTELICCPGGFIGSYTIPAAVTSIGDSAFSGCTGLTSVSMPDSVTSIDDDAFSGCTGLTNVSISNSITSINNGVFAYCTGLTSISIPDSVTKIGDYAFDSCTGLTSITIPDSVTWISWYDAFYGCDNLVIYGYKNSYAESYAEERKIPFVVLGKELKDSKTNVTVIGDIGENVGLEITELNTDDVSFGTEKKVCVYCDISLTENGEKIQPNGNVAVKIPYKDGGENIEVYRINDDGSTEKMRSSYDGEYVTFITDHFSKYAIVADGGIKGDTNNDGEVNIADALMISRYDAGMVELEKSQLALSDVNGDGEVNIADALMISRFDAGLIDKF